MRPTLLLFLVLSMPVLAQDSKLQSAYTCMRLGDFSCAAELFEPAAKKGNTAAQFQLGKLYLAGRGVEQSTAQAKKWFQLAVSDNDAAVQYALGILLLDQGERLQATEWLEQAAAQNHKAAIAKLQQLETQKSSTPSTEQLQEKWFKAAMGCHQQAIEQSLLAGVRVNETDAQQRTALHYLVACGDAAAVTSLLEKGASPNTIDKYGESPLTLAVRQNEYRIASLLLEAGATTRQNIASDESLLHIAVNQRSAPMVAELLQFNAAHSSRNKTGQTPLDIAVDLQQKSIATLLSNAGAQHGEHWSPSPRPSSTQTLGYLEDERAKEGGSSWHTAVQAIRQGQTLVLQALIEKDPGNLLSHIDPKNRSLLMYATQLQRGKCISALVAAGANPSQLNKNGLSALMIAGKQNDWPSANLLLSLGADPNAKDSAGRTIVHIALLEGHDKLANQLLQSNKFPDTSSTSGKTYLMLAIEADAEESLKTLLRQKPPLNLHDDKRRTALWYAAQYCHPELVEQLLQKGADPRATDTLGFSVLHAAANQNCIPVVRRLMHTDIKLNARSKAGNTALMLAAQQAQTASVKILLAQGVDIGIQNRKGDTALLLAVRKNAPKKLITALLEAGSDPYRRNELGESALSVAQTHYPELLKLINSKRKFKLFSLTN